GPSRIVITDTLQGSGGPLPVEIGFLVAPDLRVDRRGGVWQIDDGTRPVLSIAHTGPLKGSLEEGRTGPPRRWVSGRFGYKQPCPNLVFRGLLPVGGESVIGMSFAAGGPHAI